jgi:hypothetical protein
MVKRGQKKIENSKIYTLRLRKEANDLLNELMADHGLTRLFVVNYILRKLPIIDYADYFNYVDNLRKKNIEKTPLYLSTVQMKSSNRVRLSQELEKAETYSIINKHKLPREPSILNYFILKYTTTLLIQFL